MRPAARCRQAITSLLLQLLLLVCLGGSRCAGAPGPGSWHIPWLPWHGRSLQQQQQQQQRPGPTAATPPPTSIQAGRRGVPMCLWNDVKEFCSPGQLVLLSLDAAPTTIMHRAATAAYDRNLVCNGHPDADSCVKDSRNRCFYWNRSCVGMDAYELVNWLGAGNQVNGDAAALDFTCPGSLAARYKACRTATDAGAKGICNQLPDCQYVPVMKECMPKTFDDKPLSELQSLSKAFIAGNETVWGSCEGACFVRQAMACAKSYNSSSECKAKAYCVWEFDGYEGRNICLHKDTASRGTDAFSQEHAKVKDACAALKSQAACEEPKMRPKQVGKFRAAKRSNAAVTTEAAATCVM